VHLLNLLLASNTIVIACQWLNMSLVCSQNHF